MSTRTDRITRKVKRGSGGIVCLADVPNAKLKIGAVILIEGVPYVELEDGRIAQTDFPKLDWRIENGRLTRGGRVHNGKVIKEG